MSTYEDLKFRFKVLKIKQIEFLDSRPELWHGHDKTYAWKEGDNIGVACGDMTTIFTPAEFLELMLYMIDMKG